VNLVGMVIWCDLNSDDKASLCIEVIDTLTWIEVEDKIFGAVYRVYAKNIVIARFISGA